MDPHQLKKLNAARRERRAAVHVTDLGDGSDRVVLEGEPVAAALTGAIQSALCTGRSISIEAEGRSFFLNAYLPPVRIVAIGAVHISQALSAIAGTAGYDILIIDPRTAFATPERFGATALLGEWPEDALKTRPLDPYTALVALSHDPKIDDFPIRAALEAGCFYVGALGSRKTNAKRKERLLADGVAPERISTIHAPVGLDIGAANPAEIAVAIMAEIIQAFRRRGAPAGGANE